MRETMGMHVSYVYEMKYDGEDNPRKPSKNVPYKDREDPYFD
jgi:hypothetical protein